jgi:hypothetical protein
VPAGHSRAVVRQFDNTARRFGFELPPDLTVEPALTLVLAQSVIDEHVQVDAVDSVGIPDGRTVPDTVVTDTSCATISGATAQWHLHRSQRQKDKRSQRPL